MLKLPAVLFVSCVLSGAYMLRAAGQTVTAPLGDTGSPDNAQILHADAGHFPEQISSDGGEGPGKILQIGADARPLPGAKIAGEEDDRLSLRTQEPEAPAECQIDAAHLAIIASLGWHGMDFSDDCRILQWIATDQGGARGELVRRRIADETLNGMIEVLGKETEEGHATEGERARAPVFSGN